jgi:hypothetical protein
MPLPASDCPTGCPPDTCCNTLFLMADRIRTVAFDAVLCCVDESCRQPYRSYVVAGNRIQDLVGDSVIVTLQTATSAAMTNTPQGRLSPLSVTRSTFLLELRENGWPQAKTVGRNIEVPSGESLNAASAHSMAHAEKMWRSLVDAAATRNGNNRLFPITNNHHVIQGGVGVGPLTPVGPQAYQMAWSVIVTVDHTLPGGAGS